MPGTTAKRIKVDFEGSYVPQAGKPYDPPPLYFPAMSEPGKGKLVEPGFLSVLTGGGPAKIAPLPTVVSRAGGAARWPNGSPRRTIRLPRG